MSAAENFDLQAWREHAAAMAGIQSRWSEHRNGNGRWNVLRDAYSLMLPKILQHRVDPYFLEWDMTPIERYAWHDIRASGLPFYPQVPALRYFLDFADPVLQIAVELDGAQFHDRERDAVRDAYLWEQGWRVYRIPGKRSLPAPYRIPDLIYDLLVVGGDDEDIEAAYREWGRTYSEGFFWALGIFYYGKPRSFPRAHELAEGILEAHRYVQFPVRLYEDDGLTRCWVD